MRSVCSEKFVRVVTPALAAGDVEKLRRDVNEHWTPHELCSLLADPQVDVRRAAAVTLGLVGGSATVGCLTKALRDPDARVHRDAEDALWSVWFRGGCATAGQAFQDGMRALADDRFADAQQRLERATEIDSSFSEAFNQLAIVCYLRGDWAGAIQASRRVLALTPTHFGALAGLGHCYAHRGNFAAAVESYERALSINPRLPDLERACARLRTRMESAMPPDSCSGSSVA